MKTIMNIWMMGSLSPRLHSTVQEGSSGGASSKQRRTQQETSAQQNQTPRSSSSSMGQLSDRSKLVASEGIYREGKAREAKASPVAEAISAIQETQDALRQIYQQNTEQAKEALQRAVGKLDILLAAHKEVSLIPVSTEVHVIDTAADDDTINALTSEVDELVSEHRYQAARLLLRDLACEIDVITAFLPLATYPAAIRSAASFIEHGKIAEAEAALLVALESVVVMEDDIPLPIVRAEALIAEVARMNREEKFDKAQAEQLLDDADRQLTLAEQLGYGSRLAEFANIHDALKEVRRSIGKGEESEGLLNKLKRKMGLFKDQTTHSTPRAA